MSRKNKKKIKPKQTTAKKITNNDAEKILQKGKTNEQNERNHAVIVETNDLPSCQVEEDLVSEKNSNLNSLCLEESETTENSHSLTLEGSVKNFDTSASEKQTFTDNAESTTQNNYIEQIAVKDNAETTIWNNYTKQSAVLHSLSSEILSQSKSPSKPNILPPFNHYRNIQILYCQLRVISIFDYQKCKSIDITSLYKSFKIHFHDDFFSIKVLKQFVEIKEDQSEILFVLAFIEKYCSDILVHQHGMLVLKDPIAYCRIKVLNSLISHLENIDKNTNITSAIEQTPLVMQIIGERELSTIGPKPGVFGHAIQFPSSYSQLDSQYTLHGSNSLSIDEIDQRVKLIRKRMCRKGEHVMFTNVVARLCEHYSVPNVCKLNPLDKRLKKETDIPQVLEIIRLQAKVNAFVQAFVTIRNIATLHELEMDLCKMEGKTSFEEFMLGPLQKQPLVYEHFKFPYTKDIPKITTFDIFHTLSNLRKRQHNRFFQIDEFLVHLTNKFGFENAFELGIRIQSFPLAIQVVSRASNYDKEGMRETISKFEDHLKVELINYLRESSNIFGDNRLIQQLTGVDDIFDGFSVLTELIKRIREGHQYLRKSQRKSFFSRLDDIMMTLNSIKKDDFTQHLFLLLLSISKLMLMNMDDLPLLKSLGFAEAASNIIELEVEKRKEESKENSFLQKGKLRDLIISCPKLKDTIEFRSLSMVEDWVVRQAHVTSFEECGHGSFLRFISNDRGLKEKFESILELSNGGTTSNVSKNVLSSFVQQCSSTEVETVCLSVQLQFGEDKLPPTKKLHSTVKQILEQSNKNNHTHKVYLEALLCGNEFQAHPPIDLQDQFVQYAIRKISACPPLRDIQDAVDWGCFRWKLGSFKTFLQNHCTSQSEFINVRFIEYQDGKVVKVGKEKTTDCFQAGLSSMDSIEVCESLLSVLCSAGCVEDMPISLLANYASSVFLEKANEGGSSDLLEFCFRCFQLLPFDFLLCVCQKLFLGPLNRIYGVQNVPKLLLEASKKSKDNGVQAILHALGFRLFFKEWSEDFDLQSKKSTLVLSDVTLLKESKQTVNAANYLRDAINELKDESDLPEKVSKIKPIANGNVENTIDSIQEDDVMVESEDSIYSQQHKDLTSSSNYREEHCRALIEEIRKNKFAVGCEELMTEFGKGVLDESREREGRMLDRLSKDLYSKDSHFVLELIQNADDNDYFEQVLHKDGIERETPTVAFIVEEDKVTVLNNEKGFEDKNIRALCDVGNSTKGIHRKGYIGQKGIGFKSVFRITDTPEIHSNGFHIQFDVTKGKSGYILPEWCDADYQQNRLSDEAVNAQFCWRTEIILPLKKKMQMEKLTSRFHDIDASILMFLNRLCTIIIDDRVTGMMKVISRKRVDDNMIELQENEKTSLWFVVDEEIDINVRPDVSTTTMAVAFPLTRFETSTQMIHPQKVFAYLPLRSYGLKFIVQADFEVPSSREDIDKDSVWNQFILKEIPTLIMKTFYLFKSHPYFEGFNGLIEFFKFIDPENNILGVFRNVQVNVLKKLQQSRCLPMHNVDGEMLTWCLPSTVVTHKERLMEVVTSAMLKRSLNLNYLHVSLLNKNVISKHLLRSLGVIDLSVEHLIEVMKSQIADSKKIIDNTKEFPGEATCIQNNDDLETMDTTAMDYKGHQATGIEIPFEYLPEWIGQWFFVLATLQREHCCVDDYVSQLRALKMVPTSEGEMVALNDATVFFPIDNGSKDDDLQKIESDLCILSRRLFDGMKDDHESDEVKKILEMLGVKRMSAYDVIHDHIIPRFQSGVWKNKSDEMVEAYVKYLFNQYIGNSNVYELDEVKKVVFVNTNKGFQCPDNVYFSPSYGNVLDLMTVLPDCDWTIISDRYLNLKKSSKKESSKLSTRKQQWKDFLKKLGVRSFTCLRHVEKRVHRSGLANSVWYQLFEVWQPTKDDVYVIHDVICPEFSNLIKQRDRKQLNSFACLLDKEWNDTFASHDVTQAKCRVENSNGELIASTYCSFYLELRYSEWLCSSHSTISIPDGLYIRNKNTEKYLGNHVNYADVKLENNKFVETLGLQTKVTVDDFLREFKKWRLQDTFKTTKKHVFNIYYFLRSEVCNHHSYLEEDRRAFTQIIPDFARHPFVFLPTSEWKNCEPDLDEEIGGKFYTLQEVCWEDPSGLLVENKRRKTLLMNGFYSLNNPTNVGFRYESFSDFFIKTIGVDRYPQVSEYLEVLKSIVTKTSLPDVEACRKIFKLFAVLGSRCILQDRKKELSNWKYLDTYNNVEFYNELKDYMDLDQCDKVKDATLGAVIFPTHQNSFVGIQGIDSPILVFNKGLGQIYRQCEHIYLIEVGEIWEKVLKPSVKKKHNFKARNEAELEELTLLKALAFFQACGLPTLSELAMEPEINPEQITPGCRKWEYYLHIITPYIQRFISQKQPELYENLQTENFASYLENSRFFTAFRFEVIYRLDLHDKFFINKEESSAHVQHEELKATTYVIRHHVNEDEHHEKILEELMNLFLKGDYTDFKDDLFDFAVSILNESDDEKREKILERKKIPQLSEEASIWKYPEPSVDGLNTPQVLEHEEDDGDLQHMKLPESQLPQRRNENGERVATCWPPRNPAEFVNTSNFEQQQNIKLSKVENFDNLTTKWKIPEPPLDSVTTNFLSQLTNTQLSKPIVPVKNLDERSNSSHETKEDKLIEHDNTTKETPPQSQNQKQLSSNQLHSRVPREREEAKKGNTFDGSCQERILNERDNGVDLQLTKYQKSLQVENIRTYNLIDEYLEVTLHMEQSLEERRVSFYEEHQNDGLTDKVVAFIGRLGEEIVYTHFLHTYQEGIKNGTVQVTWINADEEVGQPYDLKIVTKNEGSSNNNSCNYNNDQSDHSNSSNNRTENVVYVEVKTTGANEEKQFEISSQQLKFAFKHKKNFHLYRVSSLLLSDTKVKLRCLENLAIHMDKKAVKLFMIL